jgi:hypothetical protein
MDRKRENNIKKMIIYVDIDETICSKSINLDYSTALPWLERIEDVNKLYDIGHTIIYWTARGSGTGKDWEKVTKKQFKEWGVKYHELRFKKPVYDIFIDDKNITSSDWDKFMNKTLFIKN